MSLQLFNFRFHCDDIWKCDGPPISAATVMTIKSRRVNSNLMLMEACRWGYETWPQTQQLGVHEAPLCFTCARNTVFQHKINVCVDIKRMVCFPCLAVCYLCIIYDHIAFGCIYVEYTGTSLSSTRWTQMVPNQYTVNTKFPWTHASTNLLGIGWHHPFLLVGLNIYWYCLVPHCVMGSRDQGEFPTFFRPQWQY